MITKNFLKIIEKIDKKLEKFFWEEKFSDKEIILKKTVKLSEEVWELSWEILSSF